MSKLNVIGGRLNSRNRVVMVWVVCCVAVIGVHILTLTIDPLMYQDEVQVLEYGRTALNPDTRWGVVWNVNEGIPILTPAYLGPAMQEIAYRLSAPSTFGSRLVAVIAGVLAASCLLGWLLARRTPHVVAIILSFALLIDPIFAGNYRGGRVDGWAFAACLGACWLLRHARNRRELGLPTGRSVFGAGLLAGISPFLWPNAPILWPLVILELSYLLWARNPAGIGTQARENWKALSRLALGGLASVIVAVLPALPQWELWWRGLIAVAEVQAFAAAIQVSIVEQFAIRDPMVAIGALIALLFCRDWGLMLAFGCALIIVYQTMVYLPRMMYLLPYFLAMIAAAASAVRSPGKSRKLGKLVMNRVMATVFLWNVGVTLILRPYLALTRWPATDPSQVLKEMERAIGEGPYRVLTEEWSAYTAGRELGWQQFHSGTAYRESEYLDLLRSMDFLVLREVPLWQHTINHVDEAGFQLQETIHFERSEPIIWSIGHLEHRFPAASYHSINVFKKADSATMLDESTEARIENHADRQ